jgi:hypothetical protein
LIERHAAAMVPVLASPRHVRASSVTCQASVKGTIIWNLEVAGFRFLR